MNGGDLRISNANYDATVLLERVRGLLARDDQLLGEAVQRSALMRSGGSDPAHVMTQIGVLPKSQVASSPTVLDYGSLLFVTEVLSKEDLLSRLSLLADKRFQVGTNSISSTGIGFSDHLEPSRNSYGEWPCTVFDVHFGHAQLPHEPLLHPTLKSFSSVHEAIQELGGSPTQTLPTRNRGCPRRAPFARLGVLLRLVRTSLGTTVNLIPDKLRLSGAPASITNVPCATTIEPYNGG